VTAAPESVVASLAIALAIGCAFGWFLERAGLGSARTLVGQFYFANLTVLKVLFSALVTAMLAAFWLDRAGVFHLDAVYRPDTFAVPQAIGGLLFGGGLLLAGLCPGTSCVAAATGRADGLAVMIGLVLGILVFNLAFDSLEQVYVSTALGPLTLPDVLHVPAGAVIAAVTGMAVGMFVLAERLEGRRRP
jgi:uncharacterized protein